MPESKGASNFDIEAFRKIARSLSNADRRVLYSSMAHIAENAERYEDMCMFMMELVSWNDENGEDLTVEERNLLSVAYKNVTGARRASWRTLEASLMDSQNSEGNQKLVAAYKKQVEEELTNICLELLKLLEEVLLDNTNPMTPKKEDEAGVFYLKMAGDYYRYLSEIKSDVGHDLKAAQYYSTAFGIAEKELAATHPIRLGLALNYSVCYYEILKEKKKACDLAKKAFDEAIAGLDKLPENSYKDSTLIMQLLRDNLTLWTSSEDSDKIGDVTVEDLIGDE